MSQLTTDEPHAPELAPSDTRAEPPTGTRFLGAAGLFLLTAGAITLVVGQYKAVLLSEGWGYLLTMIGLAALLIHAARDNDIEVRRLYGGFAAALLVGAVVTSLYPGKAGGSVGAYFLPYGALAGLVSLLFFIPFARHETEQPFRRLTHALLLAVGAALCLGAVLVGIVYPAFLVGPGVVLAVLGLGFVGAYLAQTDTATGPGFKAAVGLGILGAVATLVAVALSVVPTVLFEGPAALKTPRQSYDPWKIAAARVVPILLGLWVASVAVRKSAPLWLRGVAPVIGLAVVAVFLIGSFTASPFGLFNNPPRTYLVPYGLLLGAIGLVYLAVSVGVVSDAPLVVLTRRELVAFFYSPIAYVVLFGMAFFSGLAYWIFVGSLATGGAEREPIVRLNLGFEILAAIQAMFLVPALTMRLFSEEKRTGTLEVLLTAPVNEGSVVLSKFLACWAFYMLCWLPGGLYLIALRVVGGAPFDYLPLLSYYLALGVSGAAFLAMGLFFSSLTPNQVIAAVLTFAGMMFLLLTFVLRQMTLVAESLNAALSRFDFLSQWRQALSGQLSVPDVLFYASLTVFGLFLTTKVLETRRWA